MPVIDMNMAAIPVFSLEKEAVVKEVQVGEKRIGGAAIAVGVLAFYYFFS